MRRRSSFPALLFSVGLRLPVISLVPFHASDLACLVCTVQITVVPIYVEASEESSPIRPARPSPQFKFQFGQIDSEARSVTRVGKLKASHINCLGAASAFTVSLCKILQTRARRPLPASVKARAD